MPGLTLTLTTKDTAYNLLALIHAVAGYANTHATVRELTLVGDPGNLAANVFEGGSDVTQTNFGQRLIPAQSTTFRSTLNDISMADKWVLTDTDGAKLNADWMIY